jgi:hypothetical protein
MIYFLYGSKKEHKMNKNATKAIAMDSQTLIQLIEGWDPAHDEVILLPEATEPGYWVGCPGVFQDAEKTYMTYRRRRPRDLGAERGWHCGILEFTETDAGYKTEEIWSVHKDELGTSSMERFALQKTDEGYELYLSYVDPADDRWRVDVVKAKDLQSFDVKTRQLVLSATDTGTEGVKDPFLFVEDGVEWMFLSVAKAGEIDDPNAAHGTQDIFNTNYAQSATAVATRPVGSSNWEWQGYVLEPGEKSAWDGNTRRINSVISLSDGYLAFYDGKDSFEGNYEEQTGIALSQNLMNWNVVTLEKPIIVSDSPSGSLRYIDFQIVDGALELIYEISRPDTSHDTRVHRF